MCLYVLIVAAQRTGVVTADIHSDVPLAGTSHSLDLQKLIRHTVCRYRQLTTHGPADLAGERDDCDSAAAHLGDRRGYTALFAPQRLAITPGNQRVNTRRAITTPAQKVAIITGASQGIGAALVAAYRRVISVEPMFSGRRKSHCRSKSRSVRLGPQRAIWLRARTPAAWATVSRINRSPTRPIIRSMTDRLTKPDECLSIYLRHRR